MALYHSTAWTLAFNVWISRLFHHGFLRPKGESIMSEANSFPYDLEPIFSIGWGPFTLQRIGHPVPEGILDNFHFGGGQVQEGGKVAGEFHREGWGRIVMRTDGVGIIDVGATLETTDGALIAVTYHGRVDLGEDGYQRYLAQGFPPQNAIPLPMAVHFHTTHPNYLWLNRLQGLGIGLIEPARSIVAYNVYAVRHKNIL
jgi:hypothetical protein